MNSTTRMLTTRQDVEETIISRYDTILIDCDGVLWHGDEPIDGSFQTLALLSSLAAAGQRKRLFFVTNSSNRSQSQYCEKFEKIMKLAEEHAAKQEQQGQQSCVFAGMPATFPVRKEQMFCSSYLAARYLKHKFNHQEGEKPMVYVVGESGLRAELEETAGVRVLRHEEVMRSCGVENDPNPVTMTTKQIRNIPQNLIDGTAAVVAGWDQHFTFSKLNAAVAILIGNPRCMWVATNRDSYDMVGSADHSMRVVAAGGSMVAAIQAVVQEHRDEPMTVGKPEPWLVEEIIDSIISSEGEEDNDRQYLKSRMLMIGDRLNTDMLLGRKAGIDTLLVLTGCTTRAQLQDSRNEPMLPTYCIERLGEIARLLAH